MEEDIAIEETNTDSEQDIKPVAEKNKRILFESDESDEDDQSKLYFCFK